MIGGFLVGIVLLGLLAIGLFAALFAFWIWMIVDCAKRKFKGDSDKVVGFWL